SSLRSASVFDGAPQIKSKSAAALEPTGIVWSISVKCGSWLACDGITPVCLMDQAACIAGKPAPTPTCL
ncbi:hypothetical protein ACW9IZ_31735, partial [Pseudomonas azotoformans]